jgi:hypothetical protein
MVSRIEEMRGEIELSESISAASKNGNGMKRRWRSAINGNLFVSINPSQCAKILC